MTAPAPDGEALPATAGDPPAVAVEALPTPPMLLGESPLWHPEEAALYWVDIDGSALHRWQAGPATHRTWPLESEPGSAAPMLGGGLLLAMRDGLWHFDPERGRRHRLAPPPYDPAEARFNDGKADPQGRFWVGSLHEPRDPARSALYRYARGRLDRIAGDVTTSNGLAWSPDGRTMYWADTAAHRVRAFDVDLHDGGLSRGRVFAQFAPKPAGDAPPGGGYGGRPDGAAVDVDGGYWVAMYEGGRLLRLDPDDGSVTRELPLPVRCPTMPCFGGTDGCTLYVTSAAPRQTGRRAATSALDGRVLTLRVDRPGLPVNFARR